MRPTGARIVLADHQTLFRRSLAQSLAEADFSVVGEAGDVETLDHLLAYQYPTLVILEYNLPGAGGLEYCRVLSGLQKELPILLLAAYQEDVIAIQEEAIRAGAAGCLSKEHPPAVYIDGVRTLLQGRTLFSLETMRAAARAASTAQESQRLAQLTPREREVIALVALGYSNQQIADELRISLSTVLKHVSNSMSRMGVENRTAAAMLWARMAREDAH